MKTDPWTPKKRSPIMPATFFGSSTLWPGREGTEKFTFWPKWSLQGSILDPSQGGPKSHFFATSQHKIAKKSLWEGFQKKIENLIENLMKNG